MSRREIFQRRDIRLRIVRHKLFLSFFLYGNEAETCNARAVGVGRMGNGDGDGERRSSKLCQAMQYPILRKITRGESLYRTVVVSITIKILELESNFHNLA